jgi:hypothetical protein
MKRILFLAILLLPSSSLAQTVRGFTDEDYQKALRSESRVLFYSFSPSMPLSIDGLKEVRLAAEALSIPMLSKTGQLLAGSYEGTLRVFRIGSEAAGCEEVFDAKVVSGKGDFSRDDRFLIYVAREKDSLARMVDTIFLADLRHNATKPIYYGNPAAQLAFPGFLSPDQIVVYDQTDKELITLERTRTILP